MFYPLLSRCALAAAIACVPFFNGTPARADTATPEPTASDAPLAEIGRVLTSDRRSEPIGRTSRPTFVVTRAQIEAYGARTVSDALADVPGVERFSYGPFGSSVGYGIRGSSSEQTLVLVDGVPVIDPTSGTTFLGQFSTIGVDRIEIVESGSSTLYGANAAGGIINIITRAPRGAYLAASAGSFADRDLRVGVGDGRVGASFERHVATSAYAYPALDYSQAPCNAFSAGPCRFPSGVRTTAFGDESVARLSADLPLGHAFRVRARVDDAVTYGGNPGRVDFLVDDSTLTYGTKSALVDIERTMENNTLTLSVGASQTLSRYDELISNYGESDTYSGRTQLSLRDAYSGGHGDAVVGIDLARESGTFQFPTQPVFGAPNLPPVPAFGIGASRSSAAIYTQLGIDATPQTRLVVGVRAEHDSPFGSVLAPSLGGTVRAGAFRLAGNIGESFRVPTLQDQYYPGGSNPDLVPEKSSNADVTLAFESHATSYSLGYFGRSGSNFITLDPVSFLPLNARRAQTTGLAFTATSRAVAGIVVQANYTNLFRALDLNTGSRLPRNPIGQGAISLDKPFARSRVAFGLRWGVVGSDGDDAGNVNHLTGSYDAYDTLDANVRYRLGRDAVLTLRGFDLGDTRYAPIFGYPATGRRLFVELSTR